MMKSYEPPCGIKDGHPYTFGGDTKLLSDLSEDDRQTVLYWVATYLRPSKKGDHHSAYGLKHLLHSVTGLYITENQMKDALMMFGFEPMDHLEPHWWYRIKVKKRIRPGEMLPFPTNERSIL